MSPIAYGILLGLIALGSSAPHHHEHSAEATAVKAAPETSNVFKREAPAEAPGAHSPVAAPSAPEHTEANVDTKASDLTKRGTEGGEGTHVAAAPAPAAPAHPEAPAQAPESHPEALVKRELESDAHAAAVAHFAEPHHTPTKAKRDTVKVSAEGSSVTIAKRGTSEAETAQMTSGAASGSGVAAAAPVASSHVETPAEPTPVKREAFANPDPDPARGGKHGRKSG